MLQKSSDSTMRKPSVPFRSSAIMTPSFDFSPPVTDQNGAVRRRREDILGAWRHPRDGLLGAIEAIIQIVEGTSPPGATLSGNATVDDGLAALGRLRKNLEAEDSFRQYFPAASRGEAA